MRGVLRYAGEPHLNVQVVQAMRQAPLLRRSSKHSPTPPTTLHAPPAPPCALEVFLLPVPAAVGTRSTYRNSQRHRVTMVPHQYR